MKRKKGFNFFDNFKFIKSKHAQVTIFIILAMVIIGVGIVIYLFYPQIKTMVTGGITSPQSFIQTCMKDKVREVVNNLSLQGGTLYPDNYYKYDGNKVEYLCYTNKNYQPCVMQQPLLQSSIELNIKKSIQQSANFCFDDLEKSYKNQGYDVNLIRDGMSVGLLPQKIVVSFNNSLTLTKENSQIYKKFRVVLNNNLYELVSISVNILQWEVQYGDAETTTYMNFYHNLKVEKKLQSDGTKVYILTDLNTGDKFQFATKSFVWPSGYGADKI